MLSEKGYPKSLDHFNVSDFAELLSVYGNKPQKLAVVFPSDEIEDFFHTEYSEWGGTGDSAIKKRQCDGEICKFKYACEINGNKYSAGTSCECVCAALDLPQDHKQRCKCFMSLKAFVVNIKTGKIDSTIPYLFTSHSRNTADTIYSQIANIKALTHGHLTGIPFILSVTMREDMVDGQKKKYPIWSIQAFGTIEMVMNAAIAGILPTTDEHRIQIGEGAKQEVKQIAAAATPQDQNKSVSGDMADVITLKVGEAFKANKNASLRKILEKYGLVFENVRGGEPIVVAPERQSAMLDELESLLEK